MIAFLPIAAARRATPLVLATALAAAPSAALATDVVVVGDAFLTAINNGNVSLKGDVINPQILGGSNNQVSLVATGASITYDPDQDVAQNAVTLADTTAGTGNGRVSVAITGVRASTTNSATVTVNGVISGIQQPGMQGNMQISAVGNANTIAINTTRAK